MIRARAAICFLALATGMAACGGGGHGGGSSLVPPVAPVHPVSQSVPVKFTFTVPSKSVSAKRRPETISPLTQSLGVTVNSGTQQIFNATPTTNGCQATEGGTLCTVTIDAAVGSDSFDVSTYSGTNATGTILDTTSFTSTIVQDTTNTLNITLGPVVSTAADNGAGSLREAIADANPGDTITFLISTPATITLTSGPITLTKNVALSGPAAAPSGGRRPAGVGVGSGITIDAANASRVFTVSPGVGASISNLTLENGSAPSGNGGAIDDSGTLTLSGVTISGSSALASPAPVYGGAVAVESGASLTVSGSTITQNQSYQGGGIWAATGAAGLNISSSTLSNNTTTDSTGYNDGGAIYTNIAATLTSDTVSNNTGSAIAVDGSGSLAISGGTYSSNSSSGGYGGAIYDFAGTNTITGAKFDSNVAAAPGSSGTARGGAIYSDYDITIDSSTFSNNVAGNESGASGYGGAIEFDDGNLTVTNSTFTSNSAGGSTAQLGDGGAIYDATYNSMTVTGSTFTSNSAGGTATGIGGAIYLQGTLSLNQDSFSTNSSYGNSDGEALGGAAYVIANNSGESFTNSSFTGNTATGGNTTSGSVGAAQGGGLFIDESPGALTIDGDTFSSNSATGANYAEGGGLYAYPGIAMNGGSFDGNTSTVGNAGCNATADGGGASLSGTVAMTSVTLTNNKAVTSSTRSTGQCALGHPRQGHVHRHLIRRPQYTGSGSTNQEYALGGAIEFCGCGASFTFDKGTVSSNSATTDGGGMDLRGTSATITNSTISSNSVTATPNTDDGGGGVMIADSTSTAIDTSTIANNTVSGDTSGNDGGGGVMVTIPFACSCTPATTLLNDTLTGNSAQYGGDIYNESTTLTLTNVTVMNGTATASSSGAGGGYYGQGTNTLTIFGDIFAGGSAATQNNIGGSGTGITDNGYNIINTGNSSLGADLTATDVWSATEDPVLSALASNGGPTQTMADSTSSPGYDLIPLATCTAQGVTTDQRGNTRGDSSDGKCDAGAYEYP